MTRQPAGDRPSPDKIIAIVLRMADCQARSSQNDVALKSYQLAQKLAEQTQQTKLESVADVNEAALLAKSARSLEALPLYQKALQLDTSIHDDKASAEDWLAYGQFLADAGFPPRLAYACVLKSESIAHSLQAAEPSDPAPALRKVLENRLGSEAAAVRRNPAPALNEALDLHP
jgi:tetratricopeptide (TPR) repeat protein